eukprot:gnl/Dysnectes_brevis/4376_a5855_1130.p1 GENE.gnl/Dysnectes_brevis/4376_a5855_1130~~gnl/Dysnectes_brevis/4376_a5855_1130.p1  ORF type:complete len:205 (+),score=20.93 gnl/Dysnectes_brevis/4376_a5855_1130:70-684(+)
METNYAALYKLVIIGNSSVGKSSLISQFCLDQFTATYVSTIGIDFKSRELEIQGKKVKLQIWDTAGQERFRTIVKAYYRSAMGVLVVYDVTDRSSFEGVRRWLADVDRLAPPEVCISLVGNKIDLPTSDHSVTRSEAEAFAAEKGIPLFLMSAKTSEGVDEAFQNLADRIFETQGMSIEPGVGDDLGLTSAGDEGSEDAGCCGK